MMKKAALTALSVALLGNACVHGQTISMAKERISLKGLTINMPYGQASKLIRDSLAGNVNSATCETRAIAPTDEAFAIGDLLVGCEGNYRYFGDSITSFSAIFANQKLIFVGLGTFRSLSVESDQLPAVFRALAEKYQVTPEFSTSSRYRRFPVYDFKSSFSDTEGNTLESTGIMEIQAGGTVHQRVRLQLTGPHFLQHQRSRIALANDASPTGLALSRRTSDL